MRVEKAEREQKMAQQNRQMGQLQELCRRLKNGGTQQQQEQGIAAEGGKEECDEEGEEEKGRKRVEGRENADGKLADGRKEVEEE